MVDTHPERLSWCRMDCCTCRSGVGFGSCALQVSYKLHHQPIIHSDTSFSLCDKIKMHLFEAEDFTIMKVTVVSICLLFHDSYSLNVIAQ